MTGRQLPFRAGALRNAVPSTYAPEVEWREPNANFKGISATCAGMFETALDLYAQEALLELASDFDRLAQKAEQRTLHPEVPRQRR